VIFADADGATKIHSLEKVITACRRNETNGLSCAIGSRYEEESHAEVRLGPFHIFLKRKLFRRFLSWGMNTLVKFVLKNNIKDTQCGFKIFSRDAAKLIFPT